MGGSPPDRGYPMLARLYDGASTTAFARFSGATNCQDWSASGDVNPTPGFGLVPSMVVRLTQLRPVSKLDLMVRV